MSIFFLEISASKSFNSNWVFKGKYSIFIFSLTMFPSKFSKNNLSFLVVIFVSISIAVSPSKEKSLRVVKKGILFKSNNPSMFKK